MCVFYFFFFKQKTAYEMRISDWSSDVCSSDLPTKRIRRMRWGLVPSWTKELGKGPVLFNARADSLAEKPAFRTAFKFKRCLVPMDEIGRASCRERVCQ